MKCKNCNADLADGVVKCPFCKELLTNADNSMFDNFNFKYTITSEEQLNVIRDAVNSGSSPLSTAIKRRPHKKITFHKFSSHNYENIE